jgi:hypothetical protein
MERVRQARRSTYSAMIDSPNKAAPRVLEVIGT